MVNQLTILKIMRTVVLRSHCVQNWTNLKVYHLIPTGLPFAVNTTDKEQSQEKRAEEVVKWTRKDAKATKVDKNTCNKCFRKSSSTGHILCIRCRQWQHLKCVGLNLSEAKLKKTAFKCEDCKKK